MLRHVYPDADIPVVQLSIDENKPASFHFEIGRKLASLREEGILVLGSGNLVHNLHAYAWGRLVVEHAINATLSPNGRWLAYTLFSGTAEVYVVAYGGGQGKWQVSPNGGQVPQWSKDGKELYYLDGTQSIVAVPVKDLGNTLEFGAGQTLVSQWTVLSTPFYSVFPDGQKLLMERVSQQVSQPITVVTNFTAQLRK